MRETDVTVLCLFPHLCHREYFQIKCVAYFINADEAVYGSNKHELEYNPMFLNK